MPECARRSWNLYFLVPSKLAGSSEFDILVLKFLKMKATLFIIMTVCTMIVCGQGRQVNSDQVTITGDVTVSVTFTATQINDLTKADIGNVEFTDSKEMKYTGKNMRGIPLKDLFHNTGFKAANHKALNGFYLVCKAPDGYKVVFSYNEIFSPMSSTNFYIVTDDDGKNITEMPDRILLISCDAAHKGHKFIKGLTTIEVHEAH